MSERSTILNVIIISGLDSADALLELTDTSLSPAKALCPSQGALDALGHKAERRIWKGKSVGGSCVTTKTASPTAGRPCHPLVPSIGAMSFATTLPTRPGTICQEPVIPENTKGRSRSRT